MSASINAVKQFGFTLLEIMIAVSITAVIGIISATMLSGTMNNHAQVNMQEKNLLTLERALHIIRDDIEQISLRPVIQDIYHDDTFIPDIDKNQFKGDQSSLEFSRLNQYPGASQIEQQLVRVRYFLQDQQLIRESINTDFPSPNEVWHRQLILTGVTDLNFSFFFDRWENYLANDKKHPSAVRVQLETLHWQNIELISLLSGVDHD